MWHRPRRAMLPTCKHLPLDFERVGVKPSEYASHRAGFPLSQRRKSGFLDLTMKPAVEWDERYLLCLQSGEPHGAKSLDTFWRPQHEKYLNAPPHHTGGT